MDIEPNVFTYVDYTLEEKGYNIFCTTEINKTNVGEDGEPTMFPTLYLHELQPVEQGNDLTNQTVNAVLSTIEVKIFTKTKSECREYCGATTECMKELNFNATMLPVVTNGNDYYVGVMRFRRLVASGDSTIVN